jgi:hypothetical protein
VVGSNLTAVAYRRRRKPYRNILTGLWSTAIKVLRLLLHAIPLPSQAIALPEKSILVVYARPLLLAARKLFRGSS